MYSEQTPVTYDENFSAEKVVCVDATGDPDTGLNLGNN